MDNQTADYLEFVKIQNALDSDGYEIHNRLGKGVFGQVYEAKFKDDGNTYAIKVMPYDDNNSDMVKYQKRELQLLTKMKLAGNSNVIKYFKSCIVSLGDEQRLCIRMELCSFNLEAFVNKNKISGPAIIRAEGPPRFYEQVFEQILNGLVFIHSNDWVHRDIHPGNILIANPNPKHISDIHVKIADFGLARHIGTDFDLLPAQWTMREVNKLTPLPIPPEKSALAAPEIKEDTYDFKVDIYTAGAVLYFISRYPVQEFVALSPELKAIQEGNLDLTYIHHRDDEKLIHLLQFLLAKNPDVRPSAGAAKEYMFPTGDASMIEFFAREENETELTPCSLNKLTLFALREAVETGTGVELTDRNVLREERVVNGQQRIVKIKRDAYVEDMFRKAAAERRAVVVVVRENVETGQISSGDQAMTSV